MCAQRYLLGAGTRVENVRTCAELKVFQRREKLFMFRLKRSRRNISFLEYVKMAGKLRKSHPSGSGGAPMWMWDAVWLRLLLGSWGIVSTFVSSRAGKFWVQSPRHTYARSPNNHVPWKLIKFEGEKQPLLSVAKLLHTFPHKYIHGAGK